MTRKFDDIMKRSGEKLNFARQTLKGPNNQFRDDTGYSYTANRMLQSIENLLDSGSNTKFMLNEALASGIQNNFSRSSHNFSASELAATRDIDVIDIAIASTVASHGLTYIAMERAMDSVAQNITFQGLRAVNSAAGYTAGDKVVDPRSSMNPNINVGRSGAVESTVVVPTANAADVTETIAMKVPGTPVVAGSTIIKASLTSELSDPTKTFILGFTTDQKRPTSDGIETILFQQGGLVKDGTVNLNTGEITLTAAADLTTYTLMIERSVDRLAETSGANTLKLRPFLESTEIVSTENRIILQVAIEVQAQMNKILRKNSQYGVSVDYGKRAIQQIVDLYQYFIDVNIVRELWENGGKYRPVNNRIDLSGYSTSDYKSFSSTKNDRINRFVRQMESDMITRTGKPVTAIITDQIGALMFATDADNFIPDPAFAARRDGFIGTYNGIPIVRNVYLNGKASNAAYGLAIGVHKSVDGNAAPVAYGEYLPPYSTIPSINPTNMADLSQALFSQNATKCVIPEFIEVGEIIPYSN